MMTRTASTMERRTLAIGELRADTTKRQIVGIAASYNTLSSDLGGFREKIDPNAFRRSLAESANQLAYYNHDSSMVLGSTRAGTLELTDSPRGLAFRIDLPDTSYARDLIVLMDRGDVSRMSFGFITRLDQWDRDEKDSTRIRTLLDVDLREISVVGDPAYPDGTEAALRSLSDHQSHFARQAVERSKCAFSLAIRRAL
jgi:HK97 family phage prohead protease